MVGNGFLPGAPSSAFVSSAHNFVPTPGQLAGVTRDALSGVYCPANASEWSKVLAAAGITSGGPSLLWNLGESSGNVADSIGSFTGTVTAGTPALTYQASVPGWTRKGIAAADSTTGNIDTVSASLPDLSTTSMLVLAYIYIPSAPGGLRTLMQLGTTTLSETVNATAHPGINNGTLVGGTHNVTGQVEPWWLQNNVTGTSQTLYTLDDKVSVTYSARSGKQLKLFAGPPGCTVLYLAAFFGAAAELTSAQIKTLSQTLAWTPTWS